MAQKGKVAPTTTVRRYARHCRQGVGDGEEMIESDGVDRSVCASSLPSSAWETPTVYWHVGNRDELFNRLIEEITDQFRQDQPHGHTPAERIASISNTLLQRYGPILSSSPSLGPRVAVRRFSRRPRPSWPTR